MTCTYDELKTMTVARLKEITKELKHKAIQRYTSMHASKLLHAIFLAFGLDKHVHHDVVGIGKKAVKDKIKSSRKTGIPPSKIATFASSLNWLDAKVAA